MQRPNMMDSYSSVHKKNENKIYFLVIFLILIFYFLARKALKIIVADVVRNIFFLSHFSALLHSIAFMGVSGFGKREKARMQFNVGQGHH